MASSPEMMSSEIFQIIRRPPHSCSPLWAAKTSHRSFLLPPLHILDQDCKRDDVLDGDTVRVTVTAAADMDVHSHGSCCSTHYNY